VARAPRSFPRHVEHSIEIAPTPYI